MIIYSLSESDNWILAGDVYMASLLEPDSRNVKCLEINHGDIIVPVDGINREQRISIIGHGKNGSYNYFTANAFVNILKKLGLDRDYSGTIEYFTCCSALFKNDAHHPMHSLAHLTKNEFPNAIVIGAQGPSIIGYDNKRYVVNPDRTKTAFDKQNGSIRDCQVDTNVQVNGDIISTGRDIRNKENVKQFYNQFIKELYDSNCLINGVLVLD